MFFHLAAFSPTSSSAAQYIHLNLPAKSLNAKFRFFVSDRFEYVNQDLIISQFKGLVMINFIILINLDLKEVDHNI